MVCKTLVTRASHNVYCAGLSLICLVSVASSARLMPLGAPAPESAFASAVSPEHLHITQLLEALAPVSPAPALYTQQHHTWRHLHIAASVLGATGIPIGVLPVVAQMWKNYRDKSAKALSMDMFVCRMAADLVNLTGSVLGHQPWFIISLNAWFNLETIVYAFQSWHYKKKNVNAPADAAAIEADSGVSTAVTSAAEGRNSTKVSKWTWMISIVTVTVPFFLLILRVRYSVSKVMAIIGAFCLWASYCLMVGSRFPQIYKYIKDRSVEGISLRALQLGIASNLIAATSVLLENIAKHTPIEQTKYGTAALVLGSYIAVVLDIFQVRLFYLFRKPMATALPEISLFESLSETPLPESLPQTPLPESLPETQLPKSFA